MVCDKVVCEGWSVKDVTKLCDKDEVDEAEEAGYRIKYG